MGSFLVWAATWDKLDVQRPCPSLATVLRSVGPGSCPGSTPCDCPEVVQAHRLLPPHSQHPRLLTTCCIRESWPCPSLNPAFQRAGTTPSLRSTVELAPGDRRAWELALSLVYFEVVQEVVSHSYPLLPAAVRRASPSPHQLQYVGEQVLPLT